MKWGFKGKKDRERGREMQMRRERCKYEIVYIFPAPAETRRGWGKNI